MNGIKKLQLTDWKFHYGEIKNLCCNMTKAGGAMGGKPEIWIDENEWTSVILPHDWCAALPVSEENAYANGYKERGIGWYYTNIELNSVENSDRILLHFEGVSSQCIVYVNGCVVARNFSGYTGFICDITNYMTEGNNMVALRVDNLTWEGWWYEGAGIYRPVTLYYFSKGYLKPNETFIKPILNLDKWQVEVSYSVCITETNNFSVDVLIMDGARKSIKETSVQYSLKKGDTREEKLFLDVTAPNLWSPENPYLYVARLVLKMDDVVIDTEEITFGFRDIKWKTDVGMLLNGKAYRINGICCHQDHGGVGYALSESLLEYRVKKLKKMGCNAIRCAHHNPSAAFLSICDREGIMVMSENRNFNSSEEVKAQLTYMVKNCRNHPSVFIYSLFNEEPWQAEIRGKRIAEELKDTLIKLDDSRGVTAAMHKGFFEVDGVASVLDIRGMNYAIDQYKNLGSEKVILGTENGPVYATRGIYKSDKSKHFFDNYARVCSRFGQTIEDTLAAANGCSNVAGVFLWCGFDYRGEPDPYGWPSVGSSWGFMDLCGFEKDIYYLVRAFYDAKPFVHLMPHWNGTDGEPVKACVYSNCQTAKIYLNDELLGEKTVVDGRAEFDIVFYPGILRAEGFSDGIMCEDKVVTAGEVCKVEYEEITYDNREWIINVWALDKNGNFVPTADNLVELTTEIGVVAGSSNGNPTSHTDTSLDTVNLFSGRCQFILHTDLNEKPKYFISVSV